MVIWFTLIAMALGHNYESDDQRNYADATVIRESVQYETAHAYCKDDDNSTTLCSMDYGFGFLGGG